MGTNHARVLKQLGLLSAVVDVDAERARELGAKFHVPSFTNLGDIPAGGADGVIISTPTATHYDLARASLEVGYHVLVEKPVTGSISSATKLAELARTRDLTCCAGFIERFNPVVQECHDLIRRGHLGRIVTLSSRRVGNYPTRIRDVGVILDLAIHDIDVMRYLVGSKITEIASFTGSVHHPTHEDHANILLRFSNGPLGSVEVNWLTPMKLRTLSLTGLEKAVQVDYMDQLLEISRSTFLGDSHGDLYRPQWQVERMQHKSKYTEPLVGELLDFAAAVQDGKAPLIPMTDAIESLKAALISIEAGQSRQIITVE